MARATKSTKRVEKEPTTTSVAETASPDISPEVATTDDRSWMLDLFDWPTFLGRGWRTGLPARLFDPEHFFGERFEAGFPMRVEQFHEGEDLVIRAELPGVDPDRDVEISIEGRQLTIDATREERTETEDGHRSEFRYGKFHRSMTLPTGADAEHVVASYTDGILEVRVPIHQPVDTTKKVAVTRR